MEMKGERRKLPDNQPRGSSVAPLRHGGETDELHWVFAASIGQPADVAPGMLARVLNPSSGTQLTSAHPMCTALTATSPELGGSVSPRTGSLRRAGKPSCQCPASSHPPQTQPLCTSGSPVSPPETLTRNPSRMISCLIQMQL